MRPAIPRIVKQFLKLTTLHGFKYLSTPFWIDRLWWIICSCASACCAVILCVVLLTRFTQVPALLARLEARDMNHTRFPVLAICPSTTRVAQLFEQRMSVQDIPNKVDLPALFYSLLRGKTLTPLQLDFLETVLARHNMFLVDALHHVTDPCGVFMRVCRWRGRVLPCEQLFFKEITEWGICCMTRSDMFNDDDDDEFTNNGSMDLILQFAKNSVPNGYEFYTRYKGEEAVLPVALTYGYVYRAQLTYCLIKDSSKENKLIDINCVSEKEYSAEMCIIKCKEQQCRCSDPLTPLTNDDEFPDCTVRQMNCLKTANSDPVFCRCLPSCRTITTLTVLEANTISELGHTFDPIYAEVNASSSAVFSIRVRNTHSKMFGLMYNDTWWSLLSSLGGVFNMFLGVGVLSVLELLYFLLVQLPLACCRATQLNVP